MFEKEIRVISSKIHYSNYSGRLEIKEAISQLLQSEMQKLMLAAANENYIYKKLESPIAPEKKSEPNITLTCVQYRKIIDFWRIFATWLEKALTGPQ